MSMGVHRKENLILQKHFFIYISMGVHRKENLILQKRFFIYISMGWHRRGKKFFQWLYTRMKVYSYKKIC